MKRYYLVLALALFFLLLVIGCAPPSSSLQIPSCTAPSIAVGNSCCTDENQDRICDLYQVAVSPTVPLAKEEQAPPQADLPETQPEKEYEKEYLTVHELQEAIQAAFKNETPRGAFFRQSDYEFRNQTIERENATGIERTFNLTLSDKDRFAILQIYRDYNYIQTSDDFYNFVLTRYNHAIKENKMYGYRYVGFMDVVYQNYQNMFYNYTYDLQKTTIAGKPVYLETHFLGFIKPIDNADWAYINYKAIIWCTPELVVEVHPLEGWEFAWYPGTPSNSVKENFDDWIEQMNPEVMETSSVIVDICASSGS